MTDKSPAYTADDLTDAFWRGYQAAKAEAPAGAIPRGWWIVAAVAASIAMWSAIILAIQFLLR